jgi:DNA invertase Pin-like site-specific DNA recombinase
MRAAIYSRVSTDDGRQTLDNQIAELERFALARGWEIAARYSDQASGTKGKKERPGYGQLFADAHRRKFDVVLVWKLDRFTREGTLAALSAIRDLGQQGVCFHSYTEPFLSTTGPAADLVLSIYTAFASYEAGLIAERIRAGVRRAQAAGIHCGRRANEDMRTTALRLRQEGLSLTAIAHKTGIHISTVCRYLKEKNAA